MNIFKNTPYNKIIRILNTIAIMLLMIFKVYGQNPEIHKTIAFKNALIFNGEKFIKKDLYSINGKISFHEPKKIDTIYNLTGHYLIPPFGDAHTHNLDREWQLSFLPKAYLDEGTFYIQNLTSKLKGTKKLKPYFKTKSTPDVKYAHQGLTSTLGHPFMAYEPFEMGIDYKDWDKYSDSIKKSRLDLNNSYIFIDKISDIENGLNLYLKDKPDIAKIFLINSEDHEETFQNSIMADHGLSADVAAEVVKKLKKEKLTIYAHIESAYDFNTGIDIGVDFFAHMPGYNWDGTPETKSKYYIDDALIKKAIKHNVGVIPTLGQALNRKSTDSIAKRELVKDFLIRYHKYGGKLAFGADAFNQTLKSEIKLLIELNIFDPITILNLLCITTPQSIFPERKIGYLKEGYECSFLALEQNPLKNINAISTIKYRVKEGIDLSLNKSN